MPNSIDKNTFPFVQYNALEYTEEEMIQRAIAHNHYMQLRRSVREFSDKPVPKLLIENILQSASSAPSGAHKQPWTFCVVSNALLKKQIREAAEAEEKKSYDGRMSQEWLEDLAPLGTDWEKDFLEKAPYLIIVFKRSYEYNNDGSKRQNYYVSESVGLACGFLINAIHNAGLVALTHTPSPMNFLAKILSRPENEKPYLLIPVGYPAKNVMVPDLKRKSEKEYALWFD